MKIDKDRAWTAATWVLAAWASLFALFTYLGWASVRLPQLTGHMAELAITVGLALFLGAAATSWLGWRALMFALTGRRP